MLHVKDSLFQNFKFGAFTFLVFYSVIHSCRGESQVIGSSNPIVAQVGEGIILPCRLDPALNALDMTLEWVRPDLDPRFVFVWRDGVELKNKKHPSYQGRTSLFIDELEKGNISLKLSEVKISDEGKYRCFIPGLKKESYVQLVVGAVSSPVVTLEGIDKATSGVVLQCESRGWYPKPEVLWLDGEGKLLSAGPPETVRGPDDLYTVSSRVTVEKRHSNSFTCRVQQKDINQTREAHIHVPDDFFPIPPGSSSSAPIVIGVVVGLMVILIAAAVVVVWKCRKNKIREKKQHEDEESQNVTENKKMKKSDVINNSEQEVLMQREKERSETTAETETEETGLLSQIDGITPQIELINVLNETQANVENQPVNNRPEFRERQREQPTAGEETITGLVNCPEDSEAEAVDEGKDSLSQEEEKTEHDPNKKEKETTAETKTEETGLQSQIDEITPQIELINVLNDTQANVENQPVNNGPELRERQREQPTAGGDTNTGLVKGHENTETEAVDEESAALNGEEGRTEDLNNGGAESKSGSDSTEQPGEESQTGNYMHTESEESLTNGKTEDPSSKEKEKLTGMLKIKEREEEKSETTAETETEETGLQSQIDEITPQIESSNVPIETQPNVENQPVNNGPEFRERQREQPTAGEETITGLVNCPEDSEAEAVDEGDALNREEGRTKDLNNEGDESRLGNDSKEQPGEESQTGNYMHTESEESLTNGKTEDPSSKEKEKLTGMLKIKEREEEKSETTAETETEETGLQSQIDEITPQIESSNVPIETQPNVENQPVNNGPEFRERQREQPTAGGETITGLVNCPEDSEAEAVDEGDALNREEGRTKDLNNEGDESRLGNDSKEQPVEERQTGNNMQTESEESPTNVKIEDSRFKETKKLKEMLKAKVREIQKIENYISRREGQVEDKEKQIQDLKLQLEEMETERKLQKDKMVPETQIVEADKKLLDIQKKLEKRETDLERIKKDLGNKRRQNIKASNEKEETIKKLYEMGENEKSFTLSQDKAGNQSDSDSL